MNIAEVRDLSKQFGKFDAVRSISFDLQQGVVFGFLGPNGAGKTTTINMMTGLAQQFPQFTVYRVDAQSLRIVSEEKIDLMPLMKFFDQQKVLMREARILRRMRELGNLPAK